MFQTKSECSLVNEWHPRTHTHSVSAVSICHLQRSVAVEGCPGEGRGWFGETPSWHISPGWTWHRVATACLKHYLGLCLCHVGLPLDHISTTLPTHCVLTNHSHLTQRSGIHTRTWQWEEARLMPVSVTIMLTLCGSVCLCCPWGVPRLETHPQRDMACCWAHSSAPLQSTNPLPISSCVFRIHLNLSDSSFLSVSFNLPRSQIMLGNDIFQRLKLKFCTILLLNERVYFFI